MLGCVLQVVQVLRAIDRDQGGQENQVHFSIPPESSSALNLTVRESGGYSDYLCVSALIYTSQDWCVSAGWGAFLTCAFALLSGVTASLVLQSALEPLPGFSSSLLTLYVPVVLRDGASGLTNTGTVTVTICPCLRGGMQTEDRGKQKERRWEKHMVCLPVPSPATSLIFSLVTLLSMLACVTTLLGRCESFLLEHFHFLISSKRNRQL